MMNKWIKQCAATANNTNSSQTFILNGGGGALDQQLIASFYKNYNKIKETTQQQLDNRSTSSVLRKAENLSDLGRNKLRLKLQRHQKNLFLS
jgi:hypothetical protein